VDTSGIATRGAVVAIVDRGGNLYASMDAGDTWTCVARGLLAVSSVLVV
jgi:photosystem II stability/assembly factor-like uncharacterized protein